MSASLSKTTAQESPASDFVMLPDTRDASHREIPSIFKLPTCNNISVHEISVDELQHHYASGALSTSDYVNFCLDRIQKVYIPDLGPSVRLLTFKRSTRTSSV
jgi:hypothetical protein